MKGINEQVLYEFLNDRIKENDSIRNINKQFKEYYNGIHKIKDKQPKAEGRPNNVLAFPYGNLIVSMKHNYLFGKGVSYDIKHKGFKKSKIADKILGMFKEKQKDETEIFKEFLEDIFHNNNEPFVTNELGKTSLIQDKAVEVVYIQNDEIKVKNSDPNEWSFFVGFEGEEVALRHYTTNEYVIKGKGYETIEVKKYVIYTPTHILTYEEREDDFKLVDETVHYFGEVPVVVYQGTKEIEKILGLIDAFDKAMSEIADIIENNADPVLTGVNIRFDEETIKQLKANRTLFFNSDPDMKSEIKYLLWDQNLASYENYLDRLVQHIFLLSFTPNFFDVKDTGNVESGKALEMKFYSSANIKAGEIETNFKNALRKRLRLIAKQLELQGKGDFFSNGTYKNIEISFNKNLPKATYTLEELSKGLGLVSKHTLLQQIPFIQDADDEVEKVQKETGAPISFEDDGTGFEN